MTSVLAPNVIVVDSGALGANNLCRAVLGFRNLMVTGAATTSSNSTNYPFYLAYDNKTNTEYSPGINSGTVTITVTSSTLQKSNYFGIFSKNAGSCGLSVTVETLDPVSGNFVVVGTITGMENARPRMIYWKDTQSLIQRITLTFTSKCYISHMAIGEGVVFSRTVSTGYQPARNASRDEVMNFSTDGANFVQGRRIFNGYEERAEVRFQKYDWVDLWWREFMNHVLDSKPIFFMANNQRQNNCVFGMQIPDRLTKPNYRNKDSTDIELEINGWA